MKDLATWLENRPGALAEMGEALGRAGVNIESEPHWHQPLFGDRNPPPVPLASLVLHYYLFSNENAFSAASHAASKMAWRTWFRFTHSTP